MMSAWKEIINFSIALFNFFLKNWKMARMHETCFQIEIQMQQARLGVTFNYLLMQIPRHCDNLAFEWFPPASAIFKYIYILHKYKLPFWQIQFSIHQLCMVGTTVPPASAVCSCLSDKNFQSTQGCAGFHIGLAAFSEMNNHFIYIQRSIWRVWIC